MIFSAPKVPIRKVQVLLDTKNNGVIPLDLAYLEHLSVIVATQFATMEQLKDLTQMFYF
jgi:hypothetical protein